jgi:hypothetical protein
MGRKREEEEDCKMRKISYAFVILASVVFICFMFVLTVLAFATDIQWLAFVCGISVTLYSWGTGKLWLDYAEEYALRMTVRLTQETMVEEEDNLPHLSREHIIKNMPILEILYGVEWARDRLFRLAIELAAKRETDEDEVLLWTVFAHLMRIEMLCGDKEEDEVVGVIEGAIEELR